MEQLPDPQLQAHEADSAAPIYSLEQPRDGEYASVDFTNNIVRADQFIAGSNLSTSGEPITRAEVAPQATPAAQPIAATTPTPRQLTQEETKQLELQRLARERRAHNKRQKLNILSSESNSGAADCSLVPLDADELERVRTVSGRAAAAIDINRVKLVHPQTAQGERYEARVLREERTVIRLLPNNVREEQVVPRGSIEIIHKGKFKREVQSTQPGTRRFVPETIDKSVFLVPSVLEKILADNPVDPADQRALIAREAARTQRQNKLRRLALLIPLGVCVLASCGGLFYGLIQNYGLGQSDKTTPPSTPNVGTATPTTTPENPPKKPGNKPETCPAIAAFETHRIHPNEELWTDVRSQLLRLKPNLAKDEAALNRATIAWVLADENLNNFPSYRGLRPGDPITLYTDDSVGAFYSLLAQAPPKLAPAGEKQAWQDAVAAWHTLLNANVSGDQIDFNNQASRRSDIQGAAAILKETVTRLVNERNQRCAKLLGYTTINLVEKGEVIHMNRQQRRLAAKTAGRLSMVGSKKRTNRSLEALAA